MKQPLTYIALAALLLAGIFIGRSSNGHDDTELVKAQKHAVDSLGRALDSTQHADVVFADSVYTETLRKDSTIRAMETDRVNLKVRVYAIGRVSDHYAEMYYEAQANKDTPAMVVNCDSAISNAREMQATALEEIATGDSIISNLHGQNADLRAGMGRLQLDNGKLYASGKQIQGLYNDLNVRYRKKTNWWHRWGLPAVAGVAGVLTTHFLIK